MSLISKATTVFLSLICITGCERPLLDDMITSRISFVTIGNGGTLQPADSGFSRLNTMVYDIDGFRVWSKVRTQTAPSDTFGTVNLSLPSGDYYILAVGHSSDVSATLNGPQDVRFTASNGEKLTDTWSYLGLVHDNASPTFIMQRVSAMFRLIITDSIPYGVHRLRFDYKGGSANFNPLTLQGITKSTQSEVRRLSADGIYEVYTFPYMAEECTLQMTVSALDALDNVVYQRQFLNVPVRRNYITTFRGEFFSTDAVIDASHTSMTFTVSDWNTMYNFTF